MPSSAAAEPFSLDIAAEFGLTLRCQRDQRRWSQERLAAAANLNRTYVGELERGEAVASLQTAQKLASALGIELSALRGTNTASLPLTNVRIDQSDLLAEAAPAFLPRVRPAFLGLQCGMSIGLARASLAAAGQRLGNDRHVLRTPTEQATQALADAVQALKAGVDDGAYVAAPQGLFRLRLALNTLVQQAAQLELQASGGRAYHRDIPSSFARRWREAAFIPIVTPSVTQLLGELEKHAAASGADAVPA